MRVVVAILLLSACAPPENATQPSRPPLQSKPQPAPVVVQTEEFRGELDIGDERNVFRPCGRNETWWISFSAGGYETLRANNINGWGRWPMRVRGTLSQPGRYGHLGMYSRLLQVEQVIATGRPEGC